MDTQQRPSTIEYAVSEASFWHQVAWVLFLQIAAASVLRAVAHGVAELNYHFANESVTMEPGEGLMRALWGPTVIPGALLGLAGHRAARWVLPLGIVAFVLNAIAIDVWIEVPRFFRYVIATGGMSSGHYLMEIVWRHLLTIYLGAVITWIVTRPGAFASTGETDARNIVRLVRLGMAYLLVSGGVGVASQCWWNGALGRWPVLLSYMLMLLAGVCMAIRNRRALHIAALALALAAMLPVAVQVHWALTDSSPSIGVVLLAHFVKVANVLMSLTEGGAPCVFLAWLLTRRPLKDQWLPA